MFAGIFDNVNMKRIWWVMLVMFGYIFVSDFIVHQLILGETYQQTAQLWRTEAEMQSYFSWMLLGQLLIGAFFAMLFAKGYEGRGVGEGVRFGLLIGPFAIAGYFIQYSVMPLTWFLLWAWVAFGIIQCILGGVLISWIYKK